MNNSFVEKLPKEKIAEFCDRWKITEFALFGSILRDDFRPDSDVDVLVTFAPDAKWGLFKVVEMQQELEGILDRDRLIHNYDEIDLELVWDTSQTDVPNFLAMIEPLLPVEDE